MKRLVFNPKAYAFVKTEEHGVIDLSDYIIRGTVNRRVNAVSSAALTLQNPDNLFTKNEGVRLTPMDPITIYLQRQTGYPVRTFTGYLDKTPYYQLLPGPVELTASCTLKTLQNVYFDPVLDYTQEFLRSYGWITFPDGTVFSPSAQDDTGRGNDGTIVPGNGFQAAAAAASAISNKNIPYVWGGGHAKAGVPTGGGYDCSGYVSAILAAAGWGFKYKESPALTSGAFASWGKEGVGKELTVWYNAGHVFIEFMNGTGPNGARYADTSSAGAKNQADGKKGPHLRYGTRSTAEFKPRHWEGH